MYFKYSWFVDTTTINTYAGDITAIITGTKDKQLLSAGCNKEYTELIADVEQTNWALYDGADVLKPVFRSIDNGGVLYKYVQAIFTTNKITFKSFESWNINTHIGVNQTHMGGTATENVLGINLSVPGSVYILATPTYLFMANTPAFGNGFIGIMEYSRDSFSTDVNYPCVTNMTQACNFINGYGMHEGLGSHFGICRIKNPLVAVGDLIGANISGSTFLAFGLDNPGIIAPNGKPYTNQQQIGLFGTDGIRHILAIPIILNYFYVYPYYSHISILGKIQGGVKFIPNHGIPYTQLDEIVIDNTNNVMLAVPNGTLVLPKV